MENLENKKNNLIKEAVWYNPYTCIAENGNAYKLENIIVYSEDGVLLETDRGWFGDNNYLGDVFIGAINLRKKIDFGKKENFVIKQDKKSYRLENDYTLFIYYKNIDLQFNGYSIDSLFLRTNWQIFGTYKIDDVIGYKEEKSNSYKWNEELEQAFKKIDSYNFQSHYEEIEQAFKTIKKYHKLYEEAKEEEKNYTLKDYKKMIRTSTDRVDSYYIINTIKQTYKIDIEKAEA